MIRLIFFLLVKSIPCFYIIFHDSPVVIFVGPTTPINCFAGSLEFWNPRISWYPTKPNHHPQTSQTSQTSASRLDPASIQPRSQISGEFQGAPRDLRPRPLARPLQCQGAAQLPRAAATGEGAAASASGAVIGVGGPWRGGGGFRWPAVDGKNHEPMQLWMDLHVIVVVIFEI